MKQIYLLLFIFITSSICSQTISGVIVDQRNTPLYGANVYIDGSTIATSTDKDGNFSLNLNSKLNVYLVVSFVGFKTQYINKYEVGQKLHIILLDDLNSLDDVVVSLNQRFSRKEKLKIFRQQFLGVTTSAKHALIQNEGDIRFSYDPKLNTLTAFADKPLIIDNPYLGYRIHYELVNFRVGFSKLSIQPSDVTESFYAGVSRFEEIDRREKILKRRERVYRGSSMHFFRNLANENFNEDGFLLYDRSVAVAVTTAFCITDVAGMKRINVIPQEKGFRNEKFVAEYNVLFDRRNESKIVFNTPFFYIDSFGNYSNIDSIIFTGNLSERRTADLLPLNYGIE